MILRFFAIIGLCLGILPQHATAQEFGSNKQSLSIGFKGASQIHGIVNQNNYGQKEMDYAIPIGFAGGMSLQYKLNARSHLLAEISYQEQGQLYKDNFNNKSFSKRVTLNYWIVPVLFKYMVSNKSVGYQGVNISKPKWFASGGFQIGKLSRADIEWQIDDALTSFNTFVNDDGNPNEAQLEANGTPQDDKEFYQDIDVVLVAAFGFHSHLNSIVTASVEVRGGFGVTDLNAEKWRLENRMGEYGASHTSFLGIHAGIAFKIFEQN